MVKSQVSAPKNDPECIFSIDHQELETQLCIVSELQNQEVKHKWAAVTGLNRCLHPVCVSQSSYDPTGTIALIFAIPCQEIMWPQISTIFHCAAKHVHSNSECDQQREPSPAAYASGAPQRRDMNGSDMCRQSYVGVMRGQLWNKVISWHKEEFALLFASTLLWDFFLFYQGLVKYVLECSVFLT